jgi:succinate dehydrogenase/fumarate reductase cytochrome b subunit
MNNTINNYQPDDHVFRNVLLAVLFFIISLFYSVYRLSEHGGLVWYDHIFIGVLLALTIHLCIGLRQRA